MEEWKECKLGDFFELHRGYDLTKSEIKEGPYPVVCSTSIMGYHNEYKVKAPGVVIGRSGTLGEVQFIDTDYWPHNTSLYVSDFKGNFPKFIKYFLQLFGTGNVGGGSAVPTLNRNHLQALTVRVPPLPTQQKIAAILSSLDDKIELNNKINTNLEQQAQALFKNWFVDFEPFGGKMPEEWKVGKLSNLITVKYGKDHKKLDDGKYPVYGSGGIMRYVDKFLYDKESVLIPRKGTLNNVFYINEPFWSVDTMFYTEMKKENIAKYVYFFVKGKDLNAMNAGSAVPSMTTEILNAIEVVIPSDEYLEKFENIVSPMFKQIKQCIIENENLASIRDTLLPKLMNGEIKI
ncbi:restriction endonuclease subunit S [uncultured Treponema sp.]|uniref:restriction endonuclease subunit S n=1 Tax=uncultured Treponema sp. TaxID=162155 RepID=UPI002592CFF9|nr:restriction endonuclease subunit S [uncultured Treponema sp.]